MDVDEGEAVEALKHLGLSEYESKVFIALQRLGIGTAREVYEVADVPRSQVYGAAESLENRGLVEVQKSKPMEYRPVALDEAKARLEDRFESEEERAFSYLERTKKEAGGGGEERQDFWTVKGRDSIDARIRHLVSDCSDRLIFSATERSLVSDDLVEAVVELAGSEVDVWVMSESADVRGCFSGSDINTVATPERLEREDEGGRFLMVDSDTVLMSVLGKDEAGTDEETAIWSKDTSFATIFVQITEGWLEEALF